MAKRWYSVSVLSNFEKKIAEAIRIKAEEKGLADQIDEVLVPTEEVIEVRRNNVTYMKYTFYMCGVASVETSQSGDEESEDNCVLDWGAVEIEYSSQTKSGSFKAEQAVQWSRVTNDASHSVE